MRKSHEKKRYFEGMKSVTRDRFVDALRDGAIGFLATDTVYGVVCRAECQNSVEHVYAVRKRDLEKACIILIANAEEVKKFSISFDAFAERVTHGVWPGPVSVLFSCTNDQWAYLHRGTNRLAFRVPDDEDLRALLARTGPIIAPSANMQGASVAETIDEARKMFGDAVDVWEDAGRLRGKPSTLIAVEKNDIVLKREGRIPLSDIARSITE